MNPVTNLRSLLEQAELTLVDQVEITSLSSDSKIIKVVHLIRIDRPLAVIRIKAESLMK